MTLKTRRVAAISENPTTRTALRRSLESAGFVVDVAANLWIRPLLERFRPEALVVDATLLRGSPRGHIDAIRTARRRTGMRIYLFAANAPPSLHQLAVKLGADGVVEHDLSLPTSPPPPSSSIAA